MTEIVMHVRIAVTDEKRLRSYTSGFMQPDATIENRVGALLSQSGHVLHPNTCGVAVLEVCDLTHCIACGNDFGDPTYLNGEFGFCRPCYLGRREIAIDKARELILDALRQLQPESADPEDGVDEFSDSSYIGIVDEVIEQFIHKHE